LSAATGLVGDVGGTNARFALAHVEKGQIRVEEPAVFPAADFRTGDDALRAYLNQLTKVERPAFAVVAAAGPITDGMVTFTNNAAWSFSEAGLAKVGGFAKASLINDFTAQALAIDHLAPADLERLGPEIAAPARGTAAIMGPGTGFGAAARVDDGTSVATLTAEGGHAGISPVTPLEIELVRRLAIQHGRVSVERLISGPGLLALYQLLGEIRGQHAPITDPAGVTHAALAGHILPKAALVAFCALLGSVAGDFALAYGARRGVYISGGIAPDILDVLKASEFRARFEDKGRMSDYTRAIPTFVVVQPHAALIGAASLLPGMKAS
jgi:glucokinase